MPKSRHVIELHIPGQLGYETVAMYAAAAAARMMSFSLDRIDDLKTAVSEACLNAIEHGNEHQKTEKVLVTLTMDESKLQVDVRDKGKKFKSKMVNPSIEEKLQGKSPPRGWGMFLIKKLVDKVEFASGPEGNVTRMIVYMHK